MSPRGSRRHRTAGGHQCRQRHIPFALGRESSTSCRAGFGMRPTEHWSGKHQIQQHVAANQEPLSEIALVVQGRTSWLQYLKSLAVSIRTSHTSCSSKIMQPTRVKLRAHAPPSAACAVQHVDRGTAGPATQGSNQRSTCMHAERQHSSAQNYGNAMAAGNDGLNAGASAEGGMPRNSQGSRTQGRPGKCGCALEVVGEADEDQRRNVVQHHDREVLAPDFPEQQHADARGVECHLHAVYPRQVRSVAWRKKGRVDSRNLCKVAIDATRQCGVV